MMFIISKLFLFLSVVECKNQFFNLGRTLLVQHCVIYIRNNFSVSGCVGCMRNWEQSSGRQIIHLSQQHYDVLDIFIPSPVVAGIQPWNFRNVAHLFTN